MKVLVKTCVRYGAVAGILSAILLVVMYYSGRNPFLISPFLDFRIFIFGIFIFFALKEFREGSQAGQLYFSQAFLGSLVVVVISSVISSTGLYIFGTFEKDFVASYVEGMTAYLKTFPQADIDRIGKEVYERNLKELPSTNISMLVKTHFAQGLMIGFFISIILSVVLRKH